MGNSDSSECCSHESEYNSNSMDQHCYTAGYTGGVGNEPGSHEAFVDQVNATMCTASGHADAYATGVMDKIHDVTGLGVSAGDSANNACQYPYGGSEGNHSGKVNGQFRINKPRPPVSLSMPPALATAISKYKKSHVLEDQENAVRDLPLLTKEQFEALPNGDSNGRVYHLLYRGDSKNGLTLSSGFYIPGYSVFIQHYVYQGVGYYDYLFMEEASDGCNYVSTIKWRIPAGW